MSWRDALVLALCRWGARPALALPVPWRWHRRVMQAVVSHRRSLPDIKVIQTRIGGVPARIFASPQARGTLLWLHGGGFVLGSSLTYAHLAKTLAHLSGRRVVVPDYRLAPEHPFPAAPDDCVTVARALRAEGSFALAGDSAGGTLALVTLAALLRDGTPPERLILVSPAVDLDPDRPMPPAPHEALLPLRMLRRVQREYVARADPRNPALSPIHADFAGAPPTLIQCAVGELLEGDADAIAEHLRAGGAEVTIEKERGVPHTWHLFVGLSPKADRAVARLADFLR
ncbi:Monoterpene epsilon-lactone hydrolase [Jannaschia seosinensis]|uniref:Monoterpene epsilon-lactone hydrolase n=1 Tax=Jannaschia seosinensis TaxID=313367 RepID=A0A0M7B7K1_9RHOB|nr:alpha/beta hydrolase [Jannaschia seosinensis]CUH26381.1 Monoterpene epsilon-lactone hydrolase [Jannaschia seosinensis]